MKNPCWWVSKQTLPSGLKANATLRKSLSCLPYFHIICCSKSGTTDLFHRIKLHPDIVPNRGKFGKELLFWSWAKYGQLLLLLMVVVGSFTVHGKSQSYSRKFMMFEKMYTKSLNVSSNN